jgi:hypothetical protein
MKICWTMVTNQLAKRATNFDVVSALAGVRPRLSSSPAPIPYLTICTSDPELAVKLPVGFYVAVIVFWPRGSDDTVISPLLALSGTVPSVVVPEVKVTEPPTATTFGAGVLN